MPLDQIQSVRRASIYDKQRTMTLTAFKEFWDLPGTFDAFFVIQSRSNDLDVTKQNSQVARLLRLSSQSPILKTRAAYSIARKGAVP